jgi:hypothetical protein
VLRIRDKVATPIHIHIGYNPKEFLFRIGDAHEDNRMERIGLEICNHILILK